MFVAVLASLSFASSAMAQTWTINRSGSYKLWRNYTVNSGDAVLITASDVALDLNGFKIETRAPGTGRGIVVQSAKGVSIKGGMLGGFNANVALTNSQNVRVDGLQIIGGGLAPNGGPTEIGILLLNSWACDILNNSISSVNLGIFVRGVNSTGNRIMKNIVVGGATPANNLLGICYNPAAGEGTDGPRGDSIYNNQIARFGFAVAVSAGSVSNMFNDNTLASFTGAFREPENFSAQGGTNVEFDNTSVTLPSTTIPAP